jgi:hypothetical protein
MEWNTEAPLITVLWATPDGILTDRACRFVPRSVSSLHAQSRDSNIVRLVDRPVVHQCSMCEGSVCCTTTSAGLPQHVSYTCRRERTREEDN